VGYRVIGEEGRAFGNHKLEELRKVRTEMLSGERKGELPGWRSRHGGQGKGFLLSEKKRKLASHDQYPLKRGGALGKPFRTEERACL